MNITFSNPRHLAEFDDWPMGGNKRGRCVFQAEHHPQRGWRIGRTTTGKTKWSTYDAGVAIVDGSNGRTYLLRDTGVYGFIKISRSDFLDAQAHEIGHDPYVFPDRDPELFRQLMALIQGVNPPF